MAPSALVATAIPFAQPRLQKLYFEEEESCEDIVRLWPAHLDSPLAWEGADFKSEAEYTYFLNLEEKLEIDMALDYFKCLLPLILCPF
jgi:hypothetical protein